MKKLIVALTLLTTTLAQASYVAAPYPVPKGGTGGATLTLNGMLFGNGTSAAGVTSAGSQYQVFQAGASGIPTVGALQLNQSAAVSGALSAANGGTGASTLTAHYTLVGNGTSAVALVAPSTAGFVLTSNGAGADPSYQAATSPTPTIANGGNAAYTILSGDSIVRTGTTLTAGRAYTLPACSSNLGEKHIVKNTPAQTFNITLTPNGSDTIDGAATYVLLPGDAVEVVCAVSATWDIY